MTNESSLDFYPEGCSRNASDCGDCVRRTADALVSITNAPTPEWAASAFRRMYKHAACQLMEHTFVWSICGTPDRLESAA